MIIDVTKIVDICVKLRINVDEFFFLYLVYKKDYRNITKYTNRVDGWSDEFLDNLQKKGLLLDHNIVKSEDDLDEEGLPKRFIRNMHTTPTFDDVIEKEHIDVDMDAAYEELLEVFPYEMVIEGRKFNARTGTREENSAAYGAYLIKNPEMHEMIVIATRYGKENNLINVGLKKYIESRLWGGIIETMNSNNNNTDKDYGEEEF